MELHCYNNIFTLVSKGALILIATIPVLRFYKIFMKNKCIFNTTIIRS